MKKTIHNVFVAAVTVLAGAVLTSSAAVIVSQDGAVSPFADWLVTPIQGAATPTVNLNVPVVGHPSAGSITAATGVGPDIDHIGNTRGLTGNYMEFGAVAGPRVLALTAEFYSYQNVGSDPGDFRLYMYVGSGNTWYYDVGPLAAGWNSYTINMVHISVPFLYAGWYTEDGRTPAQFAQDLTDVDEIGFRLSYLPFTAGQQYGFDNIYLYDTYFVPEPETYLVIAVALASLAFVLRTQVRQTMDTVLATVRG